MTVPAVTAPEAAQSVEVRVVVLVAVGAGEPDDVAAERVHLLLRRTRRRRRRAAAPLLGRSCRRPGAGDRRCAARPTCRRTTPGPAPGTASRRSRSRRGSRAPADRRCRCCRSARRPLRPSRRTSSSASPASPTSPSPLAGRRRRRSTPAGVTTSSPRAVRGLAPVRRAAGLGLALRPAPAGAARPARPRAPRCTASSCRRSASTSFSRSTSASAAWRRCSNSSRAAVVGGLRSRASACCFVGEVVAHRVELVEVVGGRLVDDVDQHVDLGVLAGRLEPGQQRDACWSRPG